VTKAPDRAETSGCATRLVLRPGDERRDRNEVIRIGGMPQTEQEGEPERDVRIWTIHYTATRLATVIAVFALSGAPPPNAPIPRATEELARVLGQTSAALRVAIRQWRAKGGPPSDTVTLEALYQQRIYRLLAANEPLARRTLPRLPSGLRSLSRDFVAAQRELYRLTPPLAPRAIKVGPAAPAQLLLRYYREAERRFRVPWHVLAAVNFVESKFGKLRSASAAGAQGPMQFLPATWRRYGLGGNVHNPHDAILGAANYLHASGAPRRLRRALYAYNPSPVYVDAILRYARQIRADRTTFFVLYSWQVFVKTPRGDRRVTGP
jgi:membrane-bound lytic murein transglycosylase B